MVVVLAVDRKLKDEASVRTKLKKVDGEKSLKERRDGTRERCL